MTIAETAAPQSRATEIATAYQRVRCVVERELRPLAARIDEEGLYPSDILKKLGTAGAFAQHHEGYGESSTIDLGLAIEVMSVVSEVCLSTAFCVWCQDAFGWYLQNSENLGLRKSFQAGASSGNVSGGTGLSNPMKALSGIEPMKLRGKRVAGGYQVNGVLPWVSNMETGHYFGFCFDSGQENVAAIACLGKDGVESRPGAEFIALEGTATQAIGFSNAFIPDELILSDRLSRFARRIKPGFLLLQTGMALGLIRNCATLMKSLPARVREVNAHLPVGPATIEERLERLRNEIMTLAATPFEDNTEYLRRVLSARLEAATLSLDSTQALMLHAGAASYIRNSVYSRRLRESYFIGILTPAKKHILQDLAVL